MSLGSVTRKRAQRGARRLDMAELREAFRDGRVWTALGKVVHRPGDAAHFEIANGDVLVEVDLVYERASMTCRLGAAAGGPGFGLWAVPPPGTEVIVVIPTGELEADPAIIAVLASQQPPDGLDATTVILAVQPGAQLRVHDGVSGEAKALATEDHVHPLPHLVADIGVGNYAVAAVGTTPSSGDVGASDDNTTVLRAK